MFYLFFVLSLLYSDSDLDSGKKKCSALGNFFTHFQQKTFVMQTNSIDFVECESDFETEYLNRTCHSKKRASAIQTRAKESEKLIINDNVVRCTVLCVESGSLLTPSKYFPRFSRLFWYRKIVTVMAPPKIMRIQLRKSIKNKSQNASGTESDTEIEQCS